MEKEDKDIMNYLNDFVLYCRGFYMKTDNIINDVFNLLKTEFMFGTEADVVHNMLNMWSKWNETLPADVKLTVFNFLKNINDYKELKKGKNISIDEIILMVIIDHVKFIDVKYLNIKQPVYGKGKPRYRIDHNGMTYKEMNKITDKIFNADKKYELAK